MFDAMQLDERDGRQLRFGVGKSLIGSQVHFCQSAEIIYLPFLSH